MVRVCMAASPGRGSGTSGIRRSWRSGGRLLIIARCAYRTGMAGAVRPGWAYRTTPLHPAQRGRAAEVEGCHRVSQRRPGSGGVQGAPGEPEGDLDREAQHQAAPSSSAAAGSTGSATGSSTRARSVNTVMTGTSVPVRHTRRDRGLADDVLVVSGYSARRVPRGGGAADCDRDC